MNPVMIALAIAAVPLFGANSDGYVVKVGEGVMPFWRFLCSGSGQPEIKGTVKSYDPATGKIVWTVTDRDGYKGTAEAVISGNKITMFGDTGRWNDSGKKFVIDSSECPGGFVGLGFR